MSLDPKRRESLIRLARDAVAAAVRNEPPPLPAVTSDMGCGGMFVTLKLGDRLRGCIGTFEPQPCLEHGVVVIAAEATRDPRFIAMPITAAELDKLDVEISVLSRPTKTEAPLTLRPGIDGVLIRRGGATGCFLPQVAAERGWNAAQTLSQCCAGKANLPPDAWQDPETSVYFFTAEIIRDEWRSARSRPPRVAPAP